MARAAKQVDAEGKVDMEDSTRTPNETGRSGKPKKLDDRSFVQAFVFGAKITGKNEYRDIARRAMVNRGWLKADWKDS